MSVFLAKRPAFIHSPPLVPSTSTAPIFPTYRHQRFDHPLASLKGQTRFERLQVFCISTDDEEYSNQKNKGPLPKHKNSEQEKLQMQRFLTQRALQQKIYYCRSCLDETTATWLDEFLDHKGIMNVHRFNGLKVGSDEYLIAMMSTPLIEIPMQTRIYSPQGSKGNPYVDNHKIWDYTFNLDPGKLARSLFAIREHLAEEFIEDLNLIERENEELMRQHRQVISNKVDTEAGLQPAIFEHNLFETTSSPYRSGTYDLLKRMLTVQAVQRVIYDLSTRKQDRLLSEWLSTFFIKYGSPLLQSDKYNLGKELIQKLLSTPPILKMGPDGKPAQIVDVLSITTKILEARVHIADDQIEEMKNVKAKHLKLQKDILERNL